MIPTTNQVNGSSGMRGALLKQYTVNGFVEKTFFVEKPVPAPMIVMELKLNMSTATYLTC